MSMWKTDCVILGHKGDTGTELTFDVTPAINSWPGCTVEIMVKRPGEDTAYLAATELEGSTLTWTLQASDTAIEGYGDAEMIVYSGSRIAYTCLVKTLIRESMAETDPSEDPMAHWVETVVEAKTEVLSALESVNDTAERLDQEVTDLGTELTQALEEIREAVTTTGENANAAAESQRAASQSAEDSETSAEQAKHYAELALANADAHGIFFLEYDENGTLWYYHSENLDDLYFEMDDTDPAGTLYACMEYDT